MIVTIEISYYPLEENFNTQVLEFIKLLEGNSKIKVESGKMSSLITGEYTEVMKVLTESIQVMMNKAASVFNIKISNACPV